MYDLNKRAYISTLGEFRELLADLPDETEILACGSYDAWLHFEKDNSLVSLDYAGLDDGTVYLELDDEVLREQRIESEENEHCDRLSRIENGPQIFLIGNKLMRTFLASDGSWDYALYDINLTVTDSGQLGESRNMTREDVINTVLAWNNLEKEERNYVPPTENLVALCE